MKTAKRIDAAELAEWRTIPSSVVADVLDGAGVLAPAIRPVGAVVPFAGQALPIVVEPIETGGARAALAESWPGQVVLVDGSQRTTAVWGGNLIAIAKTRGLSAVIVDGNVRDVVELRASGIPVFSRGITPPGPHWKGRFNVAIRCGGVDVAPGDLVIGDDDGIVVVPAAKLSGLLERCRKAHADDKAAGKPKPR